MNYENGCDMEKREGEHGRDSAGGRDESRPYKFMKLQGATPAVILRCAQNDSTRDFMKLERGV